MRAPLSNLFLTMSRFITAVLVFVSLANAITRTANTGTVRWSNPTSWSPAGIPAAGDDVEITSTSNVIFDVVTPRYFSCNILLSYNFRLHNVLISEGGSLRFDNGNGASDTELQLVAQSILVAGYLEIGREDCLFARRARITLINDVTPLLR